LIELNSSSVRLNPLASPRILIVDDDPANVELLERILDHGGYDFVRSAMSGDEALKEAQNYAPDLILLDLQMPGIDGYFVLETLRKKLPSTVYLPILVVTADATRTARKKALELGASDFLTKPVDATEILLRVKNFLTMRALSVEVNCRNTDLEAIVRQRTRELEDTQIEIVQRLAMAGERRDDDTGEHTKRVGNQAALIAESLGHSFVNVELIRLAARLHDLGKIGIHDSILLKPGRLSPEEYREMQNHCASGAAILSGSQVPLLQMAERIARWHHERYDGAGYPDGLRGEQIPIEARIVAVADVFDALTHSRPYKEAWSIAKATREIESQSGTQFDPTVVQAFIRTRDAVRS
jgi:putative two-component system response regulator